MGVRCGICLDSLEKIVNPEQFPDQPIVVVPGNVNVMATPCGHVYHAYCITRCMSSGEANSRSCPNCRKSIAPTNCVHVLLDSYDFTLLQGSSDGLGDPTGLQAELARVKQLNTELKQRFDYLGARHQTVRAEKESLSNDLQQERKNYRKLYHEAKHYESYAKDKDTACKKLQEELEKFKYIKDMLEGVKTDMHHDLRNFPVTQNSVFSLVQMKHLLQQELETFKVQARNEQKEKEGTRLELLCLQRKVKLLEDEKEGEGRESRYRGQQTQGSAGLTKVPPSITKRTGRTQSVHVRKQASSTVTSSTSSIRKRRSAEGLESNTSSGAGDSNNGGRDSAQSPSKKHRRLAAGASGEAAISAISSMALGHRTGIPGLNDPTKKKEESKKAGTGADGKGLHSRQWR